MSGRLRRRLEDALDSRTAELIALRKAAVEHTAASPIKSAPLQSALGAWASGPSQLGSAPGSATALHSAPCFFYNFAVITWDTHD